MRGTHRARLTRGARAALSVLAGVAAACGGPRVERVPVPGTAGALKSAASVRAERRAYDGAPPVIPHEEFRIDCGECHDLRGVEVPNVGYAPPSPHERTSGMSAISRCRQCHVFRTTDALFVENDFAGLRQDLRRGGRLHALAPPTLPHRILMRENCLACHGGPAAREEIRTPHPERVRCVQCHVAVTTSASFER